MKNDKIELKQEGGLDVLDFSGCGQYSTIFSKEFTLEENGTLSCVCKKCGNKIKGLNREWVENYTYEIPPCYY